jgi:hypothetical protein
MVRNKVLRAQRKNGVSRKPGEKGKVKVSIII